MRQSDQRDCLEERRAERERSSAERQRRDRAVDQVISCGAPFRAEPIGREAQVWRQKERREQTPGKAGVSIGGGRGGRQSQALGAQQRADAASGRSDGGGFGSRRSGGGRHRCVGHLKLPCLRRLWIGLSTAIENCIFMSACYSISYDSPRAALGRTAHLSRGDAGRQPFGRRTPARTCATDGRPAYDIE